MHGKFCLKTRDRFLHAVGDKSCLEDTRNLTKSSSLHIDISSGASLALWAEISCWELIDEEVPGQYKMTVTGAC